GIAGLTGGGGLARARRRRGYRRRHLVRGAHGGAWRARLRARAVRASALDPLFVRHDRLAETHRAGTWRHPARAPEGARAARRLEAGRALLLVLDDRLDDVELPRERALPRRDARALRREPRVSRARRPLEARRVRTHHDFRDERAVLARLSEGAPRAGHETR